jgi:hypothetical protein
VYSHLTGMAVGNDRPMLNGQELRHDLHGI